MACFQFTWQERDPNFLAKKIHIKLSDLPSNMKCARHIDVVKLQLSWGRKGLQGCARNHTSEADLLHYFD